MASASAAPIAFDLLEGPDALQACASHPANCFQRPQWVRAVAVSRRRPHEFVAVRARQGVRDEAFLFGGVHRRLGFRVFESMPMMGYGGWVSRQPLQIEHERRLTSAWLAVCGWPLVEITSEPGRSDSLPAGAGWKAAAALLRRIVPLDTETHVLDLSGDDAALLARARPRMRSYLRGDDWPDFSFERGGASLLGAFYDWYRRGSQDWQVDASHVYSSEYFEALCRDGGMEIWVVGSKGRSVGAAAFLLGTRDVLYLASGTERAAGPNSAMDALIWRAAQHYRDRGFASMNLGASEGLESVRRFKRKFGARAVPYRRATYVLPRFAAAIARA